MSSHKIYPSCLVALLIGFTILILIPSGCKDPVDDQNGNPPADPFENYTVITYFANFHVPSMIDYYEFEHFLDGNEMYILTKGTRYDIKKAEFRLSMGWNGNSPIYESGSRLDIKAVAMTEWNNFFVVGDIFNEAPVPYSNPFLLISGDYDNMKIYNWNNRNNGFDGIVLRKGYDVYPVLLARDEVGSIGSSHVLNKYSLIFLDYDLDSAGTVNLPFDSSFIDYFDMKNETTFRYTGMKIDGQDGQFGIITHMFYAETDLEGNLLVENNLGPVIPGSVEITNIYYENIDPMNIYHWDIKNNNILNLEKYSNTGIKQYSREIELFTPQPDVQIEAICKMEKSADHKDCLIYGYFQQNMDPAAPDFRSTFLIKTSDEGSEACRVIWNKYFKGQCSQSIHILDIGNNEYFFLFPFYFDDDFDNFVFEKLDLNDVVQVD